MEEIEDIYYGPSLVEPVPVALLDKTPKEWFELDEALNAGKLFWPHLKKKKMCFKIRIFYAELDRDLEGTLRTTLKRIEIEMEESRKGMPAGFCIDWDVPAPMPVLTRAKSVVTRKLMDLREAEAEALESAPSPCADSQEVVSNFFLKKKFEVCKNDDSTRFCF
jgi:hypothetical protein